MQVENIMTVFLLEFPVFLLLLQKEKNGFLISVAIYAAICVLMMVLKSRWKIDPDFILHRPLPSILVSCFLGMVFIHNWQGSARFSWVSELLHRPLHQTCIIIAFVLTLFSLWGVDFGLRLLLRAIRKADKPGSQSFSRRSILLYLFLTAVLTITLNSKCSPLYPFNDWVDPNTMFTVGKGIFKGYVPYRDLYEQKGFVILFIHGIASLIDYTSFFGVYILEVIACFLFLLFAWQTLALFAEKNEFILIPLLAAAVYTAHSFNSGDTAEEFALPLLAYCLYLGCKSIKTDKLPDRKEFFLLGLSSGAVFWIKYSMAGIYLAWFLCFLVFSVKKGKVRKFLTGIGIIFCGVILITVPILLYFEANSALDSLWEAYFYNNIFHYLSADESQFYLSLRGRILEGFDDIRTFTPSVLPFLMLGILWFIRHMQWRSLGWTALSFICMFAGLYNSGKGLFYYSLIFSIFIPFGLLWLNDLISTLSRKQSSAGVFSGATLFLSCIVISIVSRNMYILEYEKKDLMQYQVKEFIEQSGIDQPLLMNYYILDSGVNTVAGLLPNLRFFCNFNIDNLPEVPMEMETCLQNQCVDFIIAYTEEAYGFNPRFDFYHHVGVYPVPTEMDRIEYAQLYMKD